MNRNSIRWSLPASYAVIALLAALALGSMMLLVLRNYYADQELEYLYGNAEALKPILAQLMQSNLPEDALQSQVNGLAFLSQTQIRLLDTQGNTIADSGIPDSNQIVAVSSGWPFSKTSRVPVPVEPTMGQSRVLIYFGVEGGSQDSVSFDKQTQPGMSTDIVLPVSASPYGYGFVQRAGSDPTHRSSQHVTVLLTDSQNKLGTLEFSNGPSYGADIISSVTLAWLIASVFAVIIAALIGWFMSQRVTRPVLALENATRQMEQGDLSVRVDLPNEHQLEFLSLAHSFNGMAKQVEQTVSTLRAFVSDAAHELHSPLTALQTNLELAVDEQTTAQKDLAVARALEQSQRLVGLINGLLDLSRIEATRAGAEFKKVDLVQLVHEVSEQFASHAEQAERTYLLELTNEPILVRGNEVQLKRVLTNLLENALKFTKANDSIQLKLVRQDKDAVLTISDNGIGIPPEDIPYIFERFHRGRNASEYAGNGLGLAIVKAIVTEHDGQVAIQSQAEQGTVVTITFPIAPV